MKFSYSGTSVETVQVYDIETMEILRMNSMYDQSFLKMDHIK